MASTEECYQAWRGHFETVAWRAEATGSMRAVRAIYFHWACDGTIERPATDVQFDCLTGISSCYQYFMLREGDVLMRPYSCWCTACFNVAVEGPGKRTYLTCNFLTYLIAPMPATLFNRGANKSCRAKTGAEACSPDKRARDRGHALATAGISPGQWVLVEAFGDNDDEMWLGRPWSSLISVANPAARSIRRDRGMSTACALIPGISWLPCNGTSAFQKTEMGSGLSFFVVSGLLM